MATSRMKERYNARPSERERRYHIWLMAEHPCACGCGERSTVVHHPLTRHPEQRWRRDHEFVVPMTDYCHRALHAMGREDLFTARDFAAAAHEFRRVALLWGRL